MHICFTLSSLAGGGAERVATSLSNYFVQEGHTVTIVLVSVKTNNCFYDIDSKVEIIPLLKKSKNKFLRVHILRKAMKEIKPDIVISFLPHIIIYTHFALKGLKIPLVCSERNDPNQYNYLYKFMLKKTFKKSNGVVFQTDDARKFYFNNKKNKKQIIEIIPNPVFIESQADSNFAFTKQNRFISVGRLVEQKNFKLLIDAFYLFDKKEKNYQLFIYGDGPLRNEIENQIKSLNLENRVFLPGQNKMWHEDLKKSKAFISSSDFEGMPNCLEEALCLGCLAIATNCPIGGSRDLAKLLGNTILVEPRNVKQMSQAMEMIASGKITCKKNDFSSLKLHNIGEKWISLINKIVVSYKG